MKFDFWIVTKCCTGVNEYDVTNSVNTTDPRQVSEVVCLIYRDLYQQDSAAISGRPLMIW